MQRRNPLSKLLAGLPIRAKSQLAEAAMNLSDMAQLMPADDDAPKPRHWFDTLHGDGAFVEGMRSAPITPTHDTSAAIDPAIERAYKLGEAAGREAAETQAAFKERAQRALRLRFGELDAIALEQMEKALAQTVLALCDSVLADFAVDVDALAKRCKLAASRLGTAAKDCALHLHPDDKALLPDDMIKQWRIVEDAGLERGSVFFEGVDGAISDGPAEWRAAIALAIGVSE
jgi:flagellar assembly protein FliH